MTHACRVRLNVRNRNFRVLHSAFATAMVLFFLPAFAVAQSPTGETAPPGESGTQKTVWTAHLLRRQASEQRIKGLNFSETRMPVVLVARGSDLRPTISMHGQLVRPGWKLAIQKSPTDAKSLSQLTFSPTGEFDIHLHLRGRVNELILVAMGPSESAPGKEAKETEHIYIYAPEAMEFHMVSPWDHILFSVGPAFLSYSQTGYGEYQSISAMVSGRYESAESDSLWGIFAGVDASMITFVSSPTERGPQLIEAKIDGTLKVGRDKTQRRRLQLVFGGSYLTLLSNGSSFGFSDLIAPELGVKARRTLSPITALIADVRWVALGVPSGLAFNQQGINASIAWSRFARDSRRFEFALVYSGYAFQPDIDVLVRTHQVSLRAGLSF